MDERGAVTTRVRLLIAGRVQGVGFRYAAVRQAQSATLSGYVRNLPDGRVEVVAEGPKAAVSDLIAWCRQGPRHARVDDVDVTREPPRHEFAGFVAQ